jgi:thiamine biosynthesis lipoprotein
MLRFLGGKTQNHSARYEGVLGTSLEIVVVLGRISAGAEAEKRILDEIDRLERIFSVYQPESELNRWQATRGIAVPVSHDLSTVLAEAEQWRERSNGAFLPIVESLTRAWRDKESGKSTLEMPHIEPALPMWEVDIKASTATRLTAHPASLNAIAKGYIIDRAVEVAREVEGVRQVMINIGGDLRHWGAGAARVDVSDPANAADNAPPLCTVKISNQAIATSGGYRRGFSVDGNWYSHIFDPAESKPVSKLRVSSLIAESAMRADILATILGVLRPNDGLAFIEGLDSVGALVVDSAGNCNQNAYWDSRLVTEKPKRASLRTKK